MVYPCPRGGTRWRPKVTELGGKRRFPFLVDPNTGRKMHESGDIVAYLGRDLRRGRRGRSGFGPGLLAAVGGGLASALRAGRLAGRHSPLARSGTKPLELGATRPHPTPPSGARKHQASSELSYVLHNVAKGEPVDGRPSWPAPAA